MGFEIARFTEKVDEELICTICGGVLQDAVAAGPCEHVFCKSCITQWLSRQSTCPVDRGGLTTQQLQPVPRIVRNMLARLEIRCENVQHGCTSTMKLDILDGHLLDCEFNPQKPVLCDKCDIEIPKDKLLTHSCIREVKKRFMDLIESYKKRIEKTEEEVEQLKRELRSRWSMRRAGGETDELSRWASSMELARVTRWGGMISTPDAVLQAVIKRALIDAGCPQSAVCELMENAHERRWPPGLSTLETRQLNRRHYERYVTRRVPGKQAVLVLPSDNQHMPDDLLLSSGLVMIFAHGVE